MFFNSIRNLYSQPSISHQEPTIHFKVIPLNALFNKAYTRNKSTIYPYDTLILTGPFKLDIFYDSMVYVGGTYKYRSTWEKQLSAYFFMNKSGNQRFLTCTRKSQHRKMKANRNKSVRSACCLPKLSKWLCIQPSISKDSISFFSRVAESNTTEWDDFMSQIKKDQKSLWKGKKSNWKWSKPL